MLISMLDPVAPASGSVRDIKPGCYYSLSADRLSMYTQPYAVREHLEVDCFLENEQCGLH